MKALLPNGFVHFTAIIIGVSISLVSCQEETIESPAEMQAITRSSVTTAHEIFVAAQEVLDITSDVLSDEGISIEGTNASPENCVPSLDRAYIMDLTHYDTIIYAGIITINYGNGNECANKSTKREGSIQDIFTYIINERDKVSSSITQSITFNKFKRNNIQLDGLISAVSATGSADTLKISSAKITYEDGRSIQWHGILENQRINSAGVINDPKITTGNAIADTRLITGTISSFTADGKYFIARIHTAIAYNYDCTGSNSLIPVKGVVQIQVNQVNALVDYGNGSCDRTYTVTIANKTVPYSF